MALRSFDPESAERLYRVSYAAVAAEARAYAKAHSLAPAATDRVRVGLLAIDVQNTFCLPEFELFVAGRSGRGGERVRLRVGARLFRDRRVGDAVEPRRGFGVEGRGRHRIRPRGDG